MEIGQEETCPGRGQRDGNKGTERCPSVTIRETEVEVTRRYGHAPVSMARGNKATAPVTARTWRDRGARASLMGIERAQTLREGFGGFLRS